MGDADLGALIGLRDSPSDDDNLPDNGSKSSRDRPADFSDTSKQSSGEAFEADPEIKDSEAEDSDLD